MRLFLALELPPAMKAAAWSLEQQLKQNADCGNFVRRENLHLTLVFLGEISVEHVPQIKHAMSQVSVNPFALEFGGLGRFRRPGGDIIWLGVRPNPDLLLLQSQLQTALIAEGVSLERREYRPHLTLGRRVQGINLSLFPSSRLQMPVHEISLMESSGKEDGGLRYTAIVTQKLEGAE